ncbi:MAG TPA: T9SS type A sorting domain-containing protein [Candidatus Kapabacteria bacterium]|nr:T9SS type A sorting domain-containing protein [Candidatus Kapabacteria bacterium]
MRSPIRFLLVLLIICSFASPILSQQFTVHNDFVHGLVSGPTGAITILLPEGRIGIDGQLSFPGHSFFSCVINGQTFTTNDQVLKPASAAADFFLNNGVLTKQEDTITATWTRNGIDIIQDVFPVQSGQTGQIAMRWSFVNHGNAPVAVACQYLLDISIMNPSDNTMPNANDGPILMFPNIGYFKKWQQYSGSMVPSFFNGFLRDLPNSNPGVSFEGLLDDPIAAPIKPLRVTYGDWATMSNIAFGIGNWPIGAASGDDAAVLYEFPQAGVAPGKRMIAGTTAYGTSTPASSVSDRPDVSAFTVSISPNPFVDQLHVSVTNASDPLAITLTDILGKNILLPSSDDFSINSNLLGLHSGVYLLQISNGKQTVTRTIVKE